MKKLILVFGILMLLTNSTAIADDCLYSCVEPYDMNSGFRATISKITGINYIKTKITETVLHKAVERALKSKSDLKINVESYSAKDLENGIFKSLSVSGSDVVFGDVYFSSAELNSLCNFNYVQYDKNGNLAFIEDFPMSFELKMSATDINNTMKSDKYKKLLLNSDKLSFAGIKINGAEVDLRSNTFYYIIKYKLPLIKKEQNITLTSDINIVNGEINFDNTRLTSNSKTFDLKNLKYIMNYLNPLDFSVNIFDNKNAKINIKDIAIKNNIVVINGIVVIPKD